MFPAMWIAGIIMLAGVGQTDALYDRIEARAAAPTVADLREVPDPEPKPTVTWSCTATLMDGTEVPCGEGTYRPDPEPEEVVGRQEAPGASWSSTPAIPGIGGIVSSAPTVHTAVGATIRAIFDATRGLSRAERQEAFDRLARAIAASSSARSGEDAPGPSWTCTATLMDGTEVPCGEGRYRKAPDPTCCAGWIEIDLAPPTPERDAYYREVMREARAEAAGRQEAPGPSWTGWTRIELAPPSVVAFREAPGPDGTWTCTATLMDGTRVPCGEVSY